VSSNGSNGTEPQHAVQVATAVTPEPKDPTLTDVTEAVTHMGRQLKAVVDHLGRSEAAVARSDSSDRRLNDTLEAIARELGRMAKIMAQQQADMARLMNLAQSPPAASGQQPTAASAGHAQPIPQPPPDQVEGRRKEQDPAWWPDLPVADTTWLDSMFATSTDSGRELDDDPLA
jgi:hypothetical protein